MPLIGRRAELLTLDAELQMAAAGHARIVLLSGEVGIGKSRLWHEWSASLGPETTVLATVCLDSTQALPYAPLAELFRQPAVAAKLFTPSSPVSPVWLEQMARLLPGVRTVVPHLPSSAPLPADEERRRLFEAFTQCLIALDGRPLVLFVDDVHWADRATLDWLDYAAHRLNAHPVLFVLAYRLEDTPSALARLMAGWAREGLVHRLPLARLTPAESAALIASLGGDPDITERVTAQSAGNPFFLVELYRSHPDEIPPVLSDLIRARLDRLDDTSRQVLQAAAVLGSDSDFALLRRTSGRNEEETLSALDTLLGAFVLVERDDRYAFAHPLVATVVEKGMSGARRAFVHRRAAQALEAQNASHLSAIAGELAAHYAAAGEPAQSARYAEMAAERAVALAAPEQAIGLYRQAITAEPTPTRRMGLGRVLLLQTELDAARAEFEQALNAYEAAGDRRGAARAALNMAETYFPGGRFDIGREWTRKALAFAESQSDPESHALAHLALAQRGLALPHDFAEAERNFEDATRHAIENHLPDIAARARFGMGNFLAERGDLDRAVQAYAESIEYAREAGNDYQQALGYNNLAYHALLRGDFATAHARVDEGMAFAEARALRIVLQHLYSTRGEIALAEKSWDEAHEWFTKALAEADRNQNQREAASDRASLGLVAQGRGDLDNALLLLENARTGAARLPDPHLQIKIDLWLTELLLRRGEVAAAREALARAERSLQTSERTLLRAWVASLGDKLKAKS